MFRKDLTWKCHICKGERPDHLISVLSKPLIINGQVCGKQNIRYCNDSVKCLKGAETFSFIKPNPPTAKGHNEHHKLTLGDFRRSIEEKDIEQKDKGGEGEG